MHRQQDRFGALVEFGAGQVPRVPPWDFSPDARRPEEARLSGPRTVTAVGADDQIRTGDPNLGKVLAIIRLVLMRPAESAASGSSVALSGTVRPVSRALYYLDGSTLTTDTSR